MCLIIIRLLLIIHPFEKYPPATVSTIPNRTTIIFVPCPAGTNQTPTSIVTPSKTIMALPDKILLFDVILLIK